MYNIASLDIVYLAVIFGLILSFAYIVAMDDNMTLVENPIMEANDLDSRIDLYRVRRALDFHLTIENGEELMLKPGYANLDKEPFDKEQYDDRSSALRLASSDGGSRVDAQDLDRNIHIFESGGRWEEQLQPEDVAAVSALSQDVSEKLMKQADNLDLDISLLLGLIQVESNFDEHNVSHAGAVGLMQLMPNTARPVTVRNDLEYDYDKLFDPFYNIKLGTKQVRFLLDKYDEDIHRALTAYNRGQGGLQSYINRNGTAQSTFSKVVLDHAASYEQALEDQR